MSENWHSDSDVEIATRSKKKAARPRMYKVILLNDDYSTMDFVVLVLETVFRHPRVRAEEIMIEVHEKGSGVAGVYSFQVAETKVHKVQDLAREHEHPLKCTMEAE